ncbi:PEGA domain-containing protein [Polyangium aurulentum]|uniref:PEGA domain-containing protein n=1 Tax=Polyangium aurulentum TaxID=2567896 RepID=UPI0010AE4CB7|nr:PEGA domain-containing protein [Polyangium aurulentum]UQA57842.1 tetratricopeptide repeat protein [Polyangium aurulentum]
MRRAARLVAVLSFALGLGATGAARGQGAADVALARDLFREGVELAQQGRWDDAHERYRRSLALKRAPLTLYSLGVAQQQTGRFVDAIESFRAFLAEREPESPVTLPYEQPAREAVVALEKRVARLDVVVLPAGTKAVHLEIDGQRVPEAALGLPRPVNPGERVIVVSAEGYREARTTAKLAEGESAKVTVRLEPLPGPRLVPMDPGPSTSSRALPIALLASGGTLFATGLGVGLAGVVEAASAPTRDGPEANRARTLTLAGDIAGGVGLAVLGVGTILMIVTPANPPAANGQQKAWVRPVVGTGGVGLRF